MPKKNFLLHRGFFLVEHNCVPQSPLLFYFKEIRCLERKFSTEFIIVTLCRKIKTVTNGQKRHLFSKLFPRRYIHVRINTKVCLANPPSFPKILC